MHPPSNRFRVFRVAIRSAILAFGSVAPLIAFAELSNDGLLGAGARTRPAYDGSDTQRVEAVPVIRLFGQPWFARSTQGVIEGGVRLALSPALHIGAQIAYEPGRKMSESAFLENHSVPDINRGASIGAHVEWDTKIGPAPITVLARVRQHTDSDRGAQVDLRLSTGLFQSGRFNAGAFAQATWANAKSTSSLYAITPQQSVTTRLPAFDAGSGLLFGSLGLLWSFDFTRNWIAVGSMEARHLQGDAARSPLTERSTNYYLSAGVAYHF